MSLPYMPLYVADYLAATTHLDAAQSGAYMGLLMHYWQKGSLPSDDLLLARIAKMTARQWRAAKPVLQGFFFDGWRHQRADAELEKARSKVELRASLGKQGGYAKALKLKEASLAKATVLLDENPGKTLALPDIRLEPNGSNLSKASPSRPKRVRTKTAYSELFEAFWKAYPTDANMSKQEAFAEFFQLPDDDQQTALKSCSAFRAYCSARPDYRPIHANRYILQRRFDGHARVEQTTSAQVFVRLDTPQWRAWEAFYRRTKGTSPPIDKAGSGWHFPAEWPPKPFPVLVEQESFAEMRG